MRRSEMLYTHSIRVNSTPTETTLYQTMSLCCSAVVFHEYWVLCNSIPECLQRHFSSAPRFSFVLLSMAEWIIAEPLEAEEKMSFTAHRADPPLHPPLDVVLFNSVVRESSSHSREECSHDFSGPSLDWADWLWHLCRARFLPISAH